MVNTKLIRPIDIPSDFILNQGKSYFSIVIPEEGMNLVYNPECYNTSGYLTTGTMVLDNFTNYGLNSIKATLNSNEYIQYALIVSLEENQNYTFSVSIFGKGKVRLAFTDDLGNIIKEKVVKTYDFWNRYDVSVHMKDNAAMWGGPPVINGRLRITALEDGVYYTSGWQLENKPYATTFISGNNRGLLPNEIPLPYYWTGIPHNSPSVRTHFTRSGGKIVNFENFGLQVTGYDGLGLAQFEHGSIQLVNKFGSVYMNSNVESRDFTILGILYAKDMVDFSRKRSVITGGVNPSLTAKQQPLKLIFQIWDCDEPKTGPLEIHALYNGGLEGDFQSLFGERISIDFTMLDPFIYRTGNQTKQLCLTKNFTELPNPEGMLYRDKYGDWTSLPTDINHFKATLTIGADNFLYIGTGTDFGENVPILYRFNGSQVTALVNGFEEFDEIYSIEYGVDNKLYLGGKFRRVQNALGWVENAGNDGEGRKVLNIVRYNPYTNTLEDIGYIYYSPSFGVFGNAFVKSVEQLKDGRICVVGKFNKVVWNNYTQSLNVRNIAFFNPSTDNWTTMNGDNTGLGTVATQYLNVAKEDLNGRLWVGGKFTEGINENVCFLVRNPNGTYIMHNVDSLVERTERTTMINTMLGAEVFDIEYDNRGFIYAGGRFDSTGYVNIYEQSLDIDLHVTTNPYFVAKFNDGTFRWDSVGMIATVPPADVAFHIETYVSDLERDSAGNIWISGAFNFIGQPNYDATPFSTINPAEELDTYTANTFALAKYNGSNLISEQTIVPANDDTVFGANNIKIGGYYTQHVFPSVYGATLPTIPSGLGSVGYENTIYTTLAFQDVNVACVTEIDVTCGDIFYPILTIVGPGKLIALRNYDGNLAPISFNKTLLNGEILTIDWTNPVPQIFSSLFGIQNNIVLPGSSLTSFRLFKGLNHISLLFDLNTVTSDTKAYLSWKETFLDIDSAIFCNSEE